MPFPSDEQIIKTSQGLVDELQTLFGKHPGFRPAHAKGTLLSGTFTPTAEAAKLSSAPHFQNSSTPVLVRFSNATGIPVIPDTDLNAEPRGLAVRFTLGDRVHTDIIGQSSPFFAGRTGEDMLELFKSIVASPPGTPSPSPVEKFLGSHPAALAAVQAPKAIPSSFAREAFFGVNAFYLVDAAGKSTTIRYRFVPELPAEVLDAETLKTKDANFLFTELTERLKTSPVVFKIVAQIAQEGDPTNDATIQWPEDRDLVELGTVKAEAVVPDNAKEQKHIIFDPIPRVKGVEASDDPLLEMRAAIYLISGRQRRAAP